MNRRIGILGGTFDPIHCGHVDLGSAAMAALGLSSLWLIPANVPPHREATVASGFHRFAMVALASAGREGWRASDIELTQSEPSYTSSTLRVLHRQGYAPSELFFIIGADAFSEIANWKHYPDILDGASFAVVSRPGHPVAGVRQQMPGLAERMSDPRTSTLSSRPSIILIDGQTANVSSTEIRRRRARGEPIVGLVPAAVAQHIEQHGLYSPGLPDSRTDADAAASPAGRLHGQS